jgi:hypothetical protein
MHDPEFEYRLLYTQESGIQEQYVRSSIYAMMWVYPGATSKTTSRARITIATGLRTADGDSVANQTTIELWRETGWIPLEEIFDDAIYNTEGPEEVEQICIRYLESFLLGLPLEVLDQAPTISNPPVSPKTKPKSSIKKQPVKTKDFIKTKPAKKKDWNPTIVKSKIKGMINELKKDGDKPSKKEKPKPDEK